MIAFSDGKKQGSIDERYKRCMLGEKKRSLKIIQAPFLVTRETGKHERMFLY